MHKVDKRHVETTISPAGEMTRKVSSNRLNLKSASQTKNDFFKSEKTEGESRSRETTMKSSKRAQNYNLISPRAALSLKKTNTTVQKKSTFKSPATIQE